MLTFLMNQGVPCMCYWCSFLNSWPAMILPVWLKYFLQTRPLPTPSLLPISNKFFRKFDLEVNVVRRELAVAGDVDQILHIRLSSQARISVSSSCCLTWFVTLLWRELLKTICIGCQGQMRWPYFELSADLGRILASICVHQQFPPHVLWPSTRFGQLTPQLGVGACLNLVGSLRPNENRLRH